MIWKMRKCCLPAFCPFSSMFLEGLFSQKSSLCGKGFGYFCNWSYELFFKWEQWRTTNNFFKISEHIFSSPEQEVLRLSYCDWSVIRRPFVHSSVRLSVHNYKKNLLPISSDFNQISQKWTFQNTSKNWIPWRTMVAMVTEWKNFKNLLVPNRKG